MSMSPAARSMSRTAGSTQRHSPPNSKSRQKHLPRPDQLPLPAGALRPGAVAVLACAAFAPGAGREPDDKELPAGWTRLDPEPDEDELGGGGTRPAFRVGGTAPVLALGGTPPAFATTGAAVPTPAAGRIRLRSGAFGSGSEFGTRTGRVAAGGSEWRPITTHPYLDY